MQSLVFVLPVVVLAATALVLFALEALWQPQGRARRYAFPGVALAGLGAALLLILVPPLGSEAPDGVRLFGGLFVQDPFAVFITGLAVTATGVTVLLSMGSPSVPKHRTVEYHGILVVMALGMSLLAGANHLLMIYVALETVSLMSYLVAGFDDGSRGINGGRSAEAGLKYVLYGGVASGVMIFGFSILYGLFGDLSLQGLGRALYSSPVMRDPAGQWAAIIAFAFVLTGFGFKVAAVPFHMWCPDVYEGAPTPFAALLSVGPKAAGFAVLLRFGAQVWPATGAAPAQELAVQAMPWLLLLGVMATLTMTLGNLAAIWQDNLKRMLAYSSIAHAGYMLMGAVAGGSDGSSAVVIYLAVYLVMNIGAFAVVSAVDRDAGTEDIKAFRGLGRRAPALGIAMAIFLVSLAGLPPTAGFIGKVYLFAALIKNGSFWFMMLAVVGVLNSVISLYFYARVLKAMYLESVDAETLAKPVSWTPAYALALVLAVPTLVLGLYWDPLASIARWSATMF